MHADIVAHMTLSLITLRCPDQVTPEARQVHGGEFSLGRGGDNDWVLPDPDRELSKRHCMLQFQGGAWQVSDLSTNGTFVNWDTDPIGRERPRTMRDGDRLRLGRYEIEVRLAAAADQAPPDNPFGGAPNAADRFGDDLRLGAGPSMGPAPIGLAHNVDPFAAAAQPFAGPAQPFANPAQPFAGQVQQDHTPQVGDAYRPPALKPSLLPDDWDIDPAAAPAPPPPPIAQPPPVIAAAPPAAAVPQAGTDDLMAAFLRGAGVPEAAPSDPAATMEALGATFLALVSGLRQALMARAAIKGEFRVEQTQIRPRGNNPLKFSTGDTDALVALLGAGRRTEMSAAEAVGEALRDMRLHELATTAAMQSAVRELLAQLDPARLQRDAGSGGLAVLPGARKARWWDAYEALHARTTAALSDDFDSVFGKAFARAYERALTELMQREGPA
jgi:type VI secretion system FHA domain protein